MCSKPTQIQIRIVGVFVFVFCFYCLPKRFTEHLVETNGVYRNRDPMGCDEKNREVFTLCEALGTKKAHAVYDMLTMLVFYYKVSPTVYGGHSGTVRI